MANKTKALRIALADPPDRGGWRLTNQPNLGILLSEQLSKK